MLLLSAVPGLQPCAVWGMPLWSAIGVLTLFSFETRSRTETLRRAAFGCVVFAAVNVLLAFAEAAEPYLHENGLRTQFPGRLLAERVVESWDRRFAGPLPLVGGERWIAGNVAFWAPSRPSVLTNGGLGSASLDEAACPWTSIDDFKRRGGALVWSIEHEGERLPAELRALFPNAEPLPPLALPWQTGARVPPVRIGVALVPPVAPSR